MHQVLFLSHYQNLDQQQQHEVICDSRRKLGTNLFVLTHDSETKPTTKNMFRLKYFKKQIQTHSKYLQYGKFATSVLVVKSCPSSSASGRWRSQLYFTLYHPAIVADVPAGIQNIQSNILHCHIVTG